MVVKLDQNVDIKMCLVSSLGGYAQLVKDLVRRPAPLHGWMRGDWRG